MLTDYRGNSNPNAGSQSSNKPLLLQFDQTSTPIFDTLEVTGDLVLSSLTGVLVADTINPVQAFPELPPAFGGTGLNSSAFVAGNTFVADGLGGFVEGLGGGNVTNPLDADLDVSGFLLFAGNPAADTTGMELSNVVNSADLSLFGDSTNSSFEIRASAFDDAITPFADYNVFLSSNGGTRDVNFTLSTDLNGGGITAASLHIDSGTFINPSYVLTGNKILVDNMTNDAGAAAGTIANAPVVGNPAFWMRVSINGTDLAIPAWALV